MLRADLNGDGLPGRVIRQECWGFIPGFAWYGGSGVYRPRMALMVLEPWSVDDPLQLGHCTSSMAGGGWARSMRWA